MTTLSSKLVSSQKEFFAEMVVEAVSHLDDRLSLSMIGMKKVHGGSLEVRDGGCLRCKMCFLLQETRLVKGVAFKKTFSYAGFEMQRKAYTNPKIALLNVELELKAEKDNAELRIETVTDYQQVLLLLVRLDDGTSPAPVMHLLAACYK